MNIYGTLDSILEYTVQEPWRYAEKLNSHDEHEPASLDNLLHDKVETLRVILRQVDADARSREVLSAVVTQHIEQQYCYLKTKLFELYSWELGRSRNIETRRGTLEKQLDKLNEEKRKEQVENWRDVAKLKEEFRKWFKQYCDLVQRVRIMGINVKENVGWPLRRQF